MKYLRKFELLAGIEMVSKIVPTNKQPVIQNVKAFLKVSSKLICMGNVKKNQERIKKES